MFQALRQRLARTGCSPLQLGAYALVVVVGVLFFQQRDLYHTVGSSFAMLDGHILDFYDVNRAKFFRDEYLPILYAIFALWNIPVKLLGLVSDPAALPFAVLAWSKVLLLVCFGATAAAIGRAATYIGNLQPGQTRQAAFFFATAPIALFIVCIFGQYDIIGLLFAMWGFVFYLQRRLVPFAWCFAVAVCFKYFPLVAFFPLLLLAEKNIWRLAKLTGIACSLVAFQIALWSIDPFFRETFFLHPLLKMHEAGQSAATPWLLAAYALGCLAAYRLKNLSEKRFALCAVFLPIYGYAVFFLTITWHPQWILVILPFFALASLFVDASWMVALDWLGMLAFIWIDVNYWNNNCDVTMMQRALLQDVCTTFPLQNNDLMPLGPLAVFRYIFHSYLFSPFLLLGISLLRQKVPQAFRRCLPYTLHYLPVVLFFILPSFFCAFAPISLASRIDPQAVIAALKPGLSLDTDRLDISPELLPDVTASQTFVAERDGLAAVGVKMTNFKRRITSHVRFIVQDAAGAVVISTTVDGRALKNNGYYATQFPPIADSRGKTYRITIDSPDATHHNAVAVFRSTEPIYPEGVSALNGISSETALLFRLYYAGGQDAGEARP